MVTELWDVQEFLGKNNQRGITWNLEKGGGITGRQSKQIKHFTVPVKMMAKLEKTQSNEYQNKDQTHKQNVNCLIQKVLK